MLKVHSMLLQRCLQAKSNLNSSFVVEDEQCPHQNNSSSHCSICCMKDIQKQDLPEIIYVINIMYNITSIVTVTKVIQKERKDICNVRTQFLQRKTIPTSFIR